MRFQTQEKGEEVILLLRAHPITLLPALLLIGLLLFVPLLAPLFLSLLQVELLQTFSATQLLLITVFWYLIVFGYFFYKLIFYYFNTYLLTNERIIDFDFRGILHKEISFAKLNQVQDVSPKVIGFFGTFFHFGNIYIQTAAERPEFEFHSVANPDFVAQKIIEEVRLEEAEKPGEVK
ncbi:PH domain-containing protein [Candidatus Curtissbacteria bacterium]|nr:PH domain-containing protein [Candidatus Curtissbacteria bacterium]